MGSPAWPASPGQPALRTGRSKSNQHFCPFESRHWPLPGWLFGSEAFWACASDPPTKTASANVIATTAEKRTIKTSLLEIPPPPLRRLVIRSVTIIVRPGQAGRLPSKSEGKPTCRSRGRIAKPESERRLRTSNHHIVCRARSGHSRSYFSPPTVLSLISARISPGVGKVFGSTRLSGFQRSARTMARAHWK